MVPGVAAAQSPRSAPAVKPADPCLMVIFGASVDLTRRLLVPTLYNLACDGRLPQHFAVAGVARDELTTDSFRDTMTEAVRSFHTRAAFNEAIWETIRPRRHYVPGNFDAPELSRRLAGFLDELDAAHETQGNLLLYLAITPVLFGTVADRLAEAGFVRRPRGWSRLIVEKPFGRDL